MAKIGFAGAFARRFVAPLRAQISGAHEIVEADEAGIVAHMADVDLLVSMRFTREMGQAARRLKLVQVPGAGIDRIDLAALPAGTALANVYGHEAGISEYVIGAMLYLARDFKLVDDKLRQGLWHSQFAVGLPSPRPWMELSGATLGILGYGHIGQAIAKRARAFDMEVLALRRNAAASAGDSYAKVTGPEGLDDLLRRSDYLAVTVVLEGETHHMIGERQLALMKPTAKLINVARGDVVDPAALYRALAEKRLGGAALDVWYRYPTDAKPTFPAEQPFQDLPNVLLTPHVSGWTRACWTSAPK